jgi:hypothetical protein
MFDPYYKWLGIPPKDQPPNHYRLLAIDLFESDAEVIDAAANRQMAYVQQRATGEHTALSQKLLNELSAARLCLLDPKKRGTYDLQLRINLKQQARRAEKDQQKPSKHAPLGKFSSTEPLTDQSQLPPLPPRKFEPLSTQKQPVEQSPLLENPSFTDKNFLILGGCLILLLVVAVILFFMWGGDKESDAVANKTVPVNRNNSETNKVNNTQIEKRSVPVAAAIYTVAIDPPTATLAVQNNLGAITGSGSERQIRFDTIPWRGNVLVTASCDGYKTYNQYLIPKAGQNESLSIVLEKAPSTALPKRPNTSSTNVSDNSPAATNTNPSTIKINRPKDVRSESIPSTVESPKTERCKVFEFTGGSAIVTPVQRSLPSTVEAWIWIARPAENADMFVFGSDNIKQSTGGLGIRIGKYGQLGGRRTQPNKKLRDFGTGEPAPIQKWFHLAATFDDEKICFFVDGHLVHTDKGAQGTDHPPFVIGYIGYGPYKIPPCFFVGRIRTARISSGIRYESDFHPQFNFNKNQDKEGFKTSSIYDAANVKGDVILDLSGNKHDGQGMFIKTIDEDIPVE